MGVVARLLADISATIDATDVHLFQVSSDKHGPAKVGLRYSSTLIDEALWKPLKKFQFQLCSQQVQDCMLRDEIAFVRSDVNGGGRLVAGLMKHTNCDNYILCPILHNKQLRGILGIAGPKAVDDFAPAFYELLKLNGSILLEHVLRLQKEKKRRKRLRQWQEIANQACDFAVSINHQHHIIRTVVFGAKSFNSNLDGLRLIDLVTRPFHLQLNKQIETATTERQARICDVQLSFGHEGPRWFLVRIEPTTRQQSSMATLYFTDNHPDKVMEEQVRELNDSLLKASRLSLLGQMSTEFAHQLNQPLQAILNYCRLIQRRLDKDTATVENIEDSLGKIEASVTHSGDIINRIRDFVKFRSLQTDAVPLKELIDKAMMMVIPTARGWNADLIPPIDTPDLVVDVDRAQTTHVLINLTINALEACCESGLERPRVEIYVREDALRGNVAVCIKDNGPGLPAEPSVVFKKFYSSKTEGLGMGLAISREVCEAQGGSLTAKNNSSGIGCTFVAKLPLSQPTGHDTAELPIISSPIHDD